MNEDASALSTAQRLRQQIEDDIASGQFIPGERLDEVSLATRFQVSRTPIREALQQLSMAGMVEIRPRRGALVASLTPGKLYEMFEVMAELEAMCCRLAARRLSPADVHALKLAQRACDADRKDHDAYYRANEVFHQTIYAASGNTFLAEQARLLQRRLQPYRRLQLRVRNRVQTSFSEHQEILAALLTGEGDKAALIMRAHVQIQGERFSDLIASLKQLGAA
jgi:DNA-binding GntR family transcriptional regulator